LIHGTEGEESIDLLADKTPNDFTIIVDGLEIPVIAGKLERHANAAASGWTATIAWDEIDDDVSKVLTPWRYPEAACYLGGELMCAGRLYTVAPALTEQGRVCELEGFSYTADLVDSTAEPPYERQNITLLQRTIELVAPFGITTDAKLKSDPPFQRITIGASETIFSHLAKLAAQRGVIVSSTVKGALLLVHASNIWDALGTSVGTLDEGNTPVSNFAARFDGRKRFGQFRVWNKAPGTKLPRHAKGTSYTSVDPRVPILRRTTLQAHEAKGGEIHNIAEWRRSKQMIEALTIEFPVSSWYAPNGELWRENTLVTVRSKTMFIPDGFDFLIKTVSFSFDDKGATASLSLVPPQVFTGEPVDEPWAENPPEQNVRGQRVARFT
jgi:prophage tail gpP-like protein